MPGGSVFGMLTFRTMIQCSFGVGVSPTFPRINSLPPCLRLVSCVLADFTRAIHESTRNRPSKATSWGFVDRFAWQAASQNQEIKTSLQVVARRDFMRIGWVP
jgi:hypothetical protein